MQLLLTVLPSNSISQSAVDIRTVTPACIELRITGQHLHFKLNLLPLPVRKVLFACMPMYIIMKGNTLKCSNLCNCSDCQVPYDNGGNVCFVLG